MSKLGTILTVGQSCRPECRKEEVILTVRTANVMNRFVILVVAAALIGSACAAPRSRGRAVPQAQPTPERATFAVVIVVSGSPGTSFEGSYGELGATKPVTGTVPTRLTFQTAGGFSVALQKRDRPGQLSMQVIVGGRVVSETSTSKEYGVVTYVHRPAGQ